MSWVDKHGNVGSYIECVAEEYYKKLNHLETENKRYREAFDLAYDHLCDFVFANRNAATLPMEGFLEHILAEVEITATTNELFIAKKKEEEENDQS